MAAYGAIKGMLATLQDPYTRFLTPDQFRELSKYDVTGVGLNIGEVENGKGEVRLGILGIVLGSPAQMMGARQGDELVAVNGTTVEGLSAFEAASLIQGPKGTPVSIEIRHGPCEDVKTITLSRQQDVRTPVFYRLERTQNPGELTGYIRLREFNALAKKDLVIAMKRLQEAGATSFLLDLQDNPGGLVQAGIEIARLFLDGGETDTKDIMKRMANEIDKSKVDKSRMSGSGRGGFVPGPELGGSGRFENGFNDISGSESGGFGNNSSFGSLDPDFTTELKARPSTTVGAPSKGLGMQLGKSQKTSQFLELLKQEGEVLVDDLPVSASGPLNAASTDPVSLQKMAIRLDRRDWRSRQVRATKDEPSSCATQDVLQEVVLLQQLACILFRCACELNYRKEKELSKKLVKEQGKQRKSKRQEGMPFLDLYRKFVRAVTFFKNSVT